MKVGERFGCLEIIDQGQEYPLMIENKIASIRDEKEEFEKKVRKHELKEDYSPTSFAFEIKQIVDFGYGITKEISNPVSVNDFDDAILALEREKNTTHLKCKCRKCGKIRYYTEETIQLCPSVCYKPIYISSRHTYSTRANNSNYNQRQKYSNNEAVNIVGDKTNLVPSELYCEKWNEDRKKKIREKEEKDACIIASIPRVYANNYDVKYEGMVYESLDILECVNEALESKPILYYNQRHQKRYGNITVYKQYRCKCYLCGKEQMINCDQFGIYPPTDYGATAYHGYWSKAHCKCHKISSFQWIVNKLLIEGKVPYRVEVSFPDLFGIQEKGLLRFDFGILSEGGSIKYLIECQGEQHFAPVEEFGGVDQFNIQVKNDELKRDYVRAKGIPLIELSYKEKNIELIKETLRKNGVL